jgi:hypothetical protein
MKAVALFVLLGSASAEAHEREGALQLSTGALMLPALVTGSGAHDVSAAAMAAISGEYNVRDDIALRASAAYAYALTGTNAGSAVVADRSGRFSVMQDSVPLFVGVRLDSRTWLLPVTLSFIAEGGACVIMQSQRTLSVGALSYGLPLPPRTLAAGAVNLTLSASLRLRDQIRISVDPSLLILGWNGIRVGASLAVSVAFMRFM